MYSEEWPSQLQYITKLTRAEAHPLLELGVALVRAARHRVIPNSQGAAGISGSLGGALNRLGRRTSAA